LKPTHQILVASDLSIGSEEVAQVAANLASGLDSSLTALHVLTEGALADARRDFPEDQAYVDVVVQRLTDSVKEQVARVTGGADTHVNVRIVEGDPGSEILKVLSESRFDYAVIGIRNRSRIGKLLLGSVAQEILLRSPCPVVAVPAGNG
jgi:nucleotide-binding universal stress UspA family protein